MPSRSTNVVVNATTWNFTIFNEILVFLLLSNIPYSLEKEMATHSSILVRRIPWTEVPRRLQSMGPQRVRYDWATNLVLHITSSLLFCSWTLSFLTYLGSVKQCCYEHSGACTFRFNIFIFFVYFHRSEISRSYGSSIFNFFKNFHIVAYRGHSTFYFQVLGES